MDVAMRKMKMKEMTQIASDVAGLMSYPFGSQVSACAASFIEGASASLDSCLSNRRLIIGGLFRYRKENPGV